MHAFAAPTVERFGGSRLLEFSVVTDDSRRIRTLLAATSVYSDFQNIPFGHICLPDMRILNKADGSRQ